MPEMKKILAALSRIKKTFFGDYAVKGRNYDYIYTLTLNYNDMPKENDRLPLIKSVTFNLSDAVPNLWDFAPLEKALEDYHPGFKAQQYAVTQ